MEGTPASPTSSEPSASAGLRILIVTQMWPGPDAPDLGIFVADIARELERQGHRVARATIDRRGGPKLKYLRLGWAAAVAARAFRPDVVYAHFLVPAGTLAAIASGLARVPLVVTAHGTDVRNVGRVPGVRSLTRATLARAERIVAVSDFLRQALLERLPLPPAKVEVIDSGVDLERFRGADAAEARAALGWDGEGPAFLCIGALSERKNVVRLADAFARIAAPARLAFLGEGPLRPRLVGRERVRLAGAVPHAQVARWIAACDVVCQPSLVEPFGQAVLEAMASERSVVATRIGGPPEFVPRAAGVLVDPLDGESIAAGMRQAAALPSPNRAARTAAATHDVRLQAARVEEILERAARDRRA